MVRNPVSFWNFWLIDLWEMMLLDVSIVKGTNWIFPNTNTVIELLPGVLDIRDGSPPAHHVVDAIDISDVFIIHEVLIQNRHSQFEKRKNSDSVCGQLF